jgi:hypothetical protein
MKHHLVLLKRGVELLPHTAAYQVSLLLRAPCEKQVRLLPLPRLPLVAWTTIDNIRLRARMAGWLASPQPWWRFARELDPFHIVPRRLVFETPAPTDSTHQTIQSIFLDGKHYRTTPQYEAMVRCVEQKQRAGSWGCRTVAEVEQYFQRLHAAFESIRVHGYLSQRQQGRLLPDEIPLYISRDGHLVKLAFSANHRFLMAEILGVRWVPVVLRGAHPEWLLRVSRELDRPPHRAYSEWMVANDRFRAQ